MARILTAIALAAVVLAAGCTDANAQVVRDNKVRMQVERVDGNGFPLTPDFTQYSRSDTFDLKLVYGDSVAALTETLGIVGPPAWLVLEWDEESAATNLWYQAKELEDGARDIPDTLQSYAWGAWTCFFVNGNATPVGGVPIGSCGLIDSIRFKCFGTDDQIINLNLRGEYIAKTWRASDAAAD